MTELPELVSMKREEMARMKMLRGATKTLLAALNLDSKDEHFRETPDRVAKSYREFCWGCFVNFDVEVRSIMKSQFTFHDDQLMGTKVSVWSLCPHHLLPTHMKVKISYLPDGWILGLSKLHRLANLVASIPSCQETAASIIADLMMKHVKGIQGVMVNVIGFHLCTIMRGVKDSEMAFYNNAIRGKFREEERLVTEALKMIELMEKEQRGV